MTSRDVVKLAWRVALAAVTVCGLAQTPAQAHPHVWVTVEATVLYDDKQQVTGLKESWTFDKAYSEYALDGLEKDASGKYTPAAYVELAKENMESLRDYNYFTEVYLEGARAELGQPEGAVVVRDDKTILHLTYTMPLKQPVNVGTLKLSFLIYDPDFYISFAFAEKDPIHLAKGGPAGCAPKIEAATGDPAKSKTWGGAYAATVVVACKG